ncbi:uncharacterized protein [Palaemon carinicauda]|uniref:uncharacterized protein isoform X2 n=1 Tax=Palaemon carinicauda TaxID=392227 RepID=UPI0035B67745
MALQGLLASLGNKNRIKGEDLFPGTKFGVKYPSARRKSNKDYAIQSASEIFFLSQEPDQEERDAGAVSELENRDSLINSSPVDDFRLPKGRIPIKKFKTRLEIEGLMHPDDWMKKHKKKKKTNDTKRVSPKGEPQDFITLMKNKHKLMYGDDTQPSQLLKQVQNTQQPPSVDIIEYGAALTGDENIMVKERNIITAPNFNKVNENLAGPSFHSNNHMLLNSAPSMTLPHKFPPHPFNLGYNSRGPSMYPYYPSLISPLLEASTEVPPSLECKSRQDLTLCQSFIGNHHYTTDSGPINSSVCQRNESEAFDPINFDANEDDPINGSHSCHPEVFQLLDKISEHTLSFSDRGLVSVGDCYQIFDNESMYVKNSSPIRVRGEPERMQSPLEDVTNHSDREFHKVDIEVQYDGSKDYSKANFMAGSFSPVLGSSIHVTRRKKFSRSCKPKSSFHKETVSPFCQEDPFIHGESNSMSRPYNPSTPGKFYIPSPRQYKNTLRKVSFEDGDEVRSYLGKKGDMRDSLKSNQKDFEEQRICNSPDLFASQDPMFVNSAVTAMDTYVNNDVSELFSISHSGNVCYQSASDEKYENFPGNQAAFRETDANKANSNGYNFNERDSVKLHDNNMIDDTPPDSAAEFSPQISFRHTEDAYRSQKGVVRVSTLEGEMIINPEHWRLAHKFTGLFSRKAELVSQNIILGPGNNQLDEPHRVTTTEELLKLYTST